MGTDSYIMHGGGVAQLFNRSKYP